MNLIKSKAELLHEMKRLLWIGLLAVTYFGLLANESMHIVASGETLFSIARRYSVSVEALLAFNNITRPESLAIGTRLRIPSSSIITDNSTVNNTANSNPSSSHRPTHHTVQPGETYFSIARRYQLSVAQLLALNNRTENDVLRSGEVLRLTADAGGATSTQPSVVSNPSIASSAQAPIPTSASMPLSQPSSSSSTPLNSVLFWPVSGTISPYTGKQGGVQISVNSEVTVRSVASGVVVYIGPFRELGNIVLVEHAGGYVYIYGGLDAVFVRQGDKVSPGHSLGRIAGVGSMMIFSVFKDSNPIDPSEAPRS